MLLASGSIDGYISFLFSFLVVGETTYCKEKIACAWTGEIGDGCRDFSPKNADINVKKKLQLLPSKLIQRWYFR